MAHLDPKDAVPHSQPKTKNKKKSTVALDTHTDAADKENEGFEAINMKKAHVIIACVILLQIFILFTVFPGGQSILHLQMNFLP